ncbi:MAG: hypothetical protein Q9166_006839 [cf. Caloplaca sp. 2 TL-2023]
MLEVPTLGMIPKLDVQSKPIFDVRMANPSSHPLLSDFDEDEIRFAIQNSLRDAPSDEGDDEESDPDERPRYPSTMFDSLMRETSDLQLPDWATLSPELFMPTTSQTLSARQRSEMSLRLDILEDSDGASSHREPIKWGGSVWAPSGAGHSSEVTDPLSEMQALRSRMDMLQSLLPQSDQQIQAPPLEGSQSEDEQTSWQLQGLNSTGKMQGTNRLSPLGGNRLSASLRNNNPRCRSKSSQVGASGQHHLDLMEPHLQHLRTEARDSTSSLNDVNVAEPQIEPWWLSQDGRVRSGNGELPQRRIFYFYRLSLGAISVEQYPFMDPSISLRWGARFTPNTPRRLSTNVSAQRPSSLRPRPSAPSAMSNYRPKTTSTPKRRRIIPDSNLPKDSQQAWFALDRDYQGLKYRPSTLPKYLVSPFMPGANVVFLSQLIPQGLHHSKRAQILSLIRAEAPYVPLCVLEVKPLAVGREKLKPTIEDFLAAKTKQKRSFEHPYRPNGAGWPTNASFEEEHPRSLPVEIFELIGSLLPRDSIQSMRLVNREFERKISCYAFKSVVVPFKPKIYETAGTQMSAKTMGKQKETDQIVENPMTIQQPIKDTYNPRVCHVKDGMRVFEEWGPEIKRFALTFEVAEENLTKLKPKRRFEVTNTFWGSYKWPHPHYSRYEQAAKLEQKADETSAMTAAFSRLTGMRELGLSVLSGLGWLAGKDISDRAKLLEKKPTVFGTQYALPDRELRESMRKWEAITFLETSKIIRNRNKTGRGFFEATREISPVNNLPRLVFKNVAPSNSHIRPPIMFDKENLEAKDQSTVDVTDELIDIVPSLTPSTTTTSLESPGVIPNALTSEQEDWLMEMEWAQRAFLSSWCIALLDNPTIFHSLRTFNITNLSSKYLVSLQRDDIWRALPSLENLTVLVSPDWRQVSKDSQGIVSTEQIRPSSAQTLFWNFLSALFNEIQSIRTLKIGYTDGGEHATGMYARNQNIIPAPIDQYPFPPSGDPSLTQETLYLPHIKHLTLKNCWLTPATLKNLFTRAQSPRLKTATFDSVSLTANPDIHPPNHDDDNTINTIFPDRSLRWLDQNPTPGSWPDIINTITPGPSIAHARYTHGRLSSPPPSPSSSSSSPLIPTLQQLTFQSCGYVRLPNLHDFDQSSLPELPSGPPQCLKRRMAEIQRGMLDGKEDGMLGTIVPVMREEEEGALAGVWGLEMGWQGLWRGRVWECREDGGVEGGSGRFGGVVRRERG